LGLRLFRTAITEFLLFQLDFDRNYR